MSSGFVSGGTTDAPIERDDKWLAVQLEIEKERQERKDREKAAAEGKSLFETLEANKAAKQEAFEEANRLKNQFRALDDDEIEFLNEVRGREREEEEKVRKETKEGLDAFRKHREEMEKKEREKEAPHDVVEEVKEDEWKVGRKRKASGQKAGGLGIKLRKTSTAGSKDDEKVSTQREDSAKTTESAQKSYAGNNGEESGSKGATHLKANGDAQAHVPLSRNEDMKDQSICAGNLRDDTALVSQPATKSTTALVSYGSDEDDDW